MRNQIRGLMIEKGLPSFYLTINPADVYNPLVKFLAGDEIDLDKLTMDTVPDYFNQSCLIAKNPAVAAEFFNVYMKAFISEILGYDPKQDDLEGGILGVVKAYYGCVEAQGRGTLHCHMLVWLEGGLNPNQIKEKALANGCDLEFQKKLLAFLDDTISNSVPADPDPTFELDLGKVHQCATRGPTESDIGQNASISRKKDLHNLVKKCQFHTHHPTCYKYWRGAPEPKECRFDLDEKNTVPVSVFDPETGELTLRCLDGLVNNFNETMLEAIRCNMDIKFIGSGPAAKAILYYITDYITKTQLQAHVAYAALELAVGRLGEYDPNADDYTVRARRLLQKCAHAMIAKQELSAQQVVSYLMGYEDHFTSHKFSSLYWTGFVKFINDEAPSPECYRTSVELSAPVIQSNELGSEEEQGLTNSED
ncbi:ATP-dependent DNA helicase [Mycena venus]|uniref:ATP-dependent DNA helicase n=1 Tax=Mycena venus TaxID=2733690 RepID=A0A8H6Z8F1_9AGAR|nr:ATP-dependent DNA helicase [Mycena venus]